MSPDTATATLGVAFSFMVGVTGSPPPAITTRFDRCTCTHRGYPQRFGLPKRRCKVVRLFFRPECDCANVVALVPTPDHLGYWLVGSDGGTPPTAGHPHREGQDRTALPSRTPAWPAMPSSRRTPSGHYPGDVPEISPPAAISATLDFLGGTVALSVQRLAALHGQRTLRTVPASDGSPCTIAP